jgi:oxygen-independent coproporphyrinogen-3 oxidase
VPVAGLYVHVPFRPARRSYGDSDYVVSDPPDVGRYTAALRRELRHVASTYVAEEAPTTLYVGGGRPSLLPLSTVCSVLRTLADTVDVSTVEEATVEVSPADATPRYVHDLKRLGVNRLSLEVLSFHPEDLRSVDAPHSAATARRALTLVQEAGFDTISVDLLFGLPSQSVAAWETTLRRVINQGVPHVTILEASATAPSLEETRAEQMERAMTLFRSAGYAQYELTHFARSGHRSAHQENYYAHGNYLGVGPSSESFWWPDRSLPRRARRWGNVNDVNRYADLLRRRHPPVAYRQTLDRHALAQEYVLLRLRTGEGLDLHRLRSEYDLDLRAAKANLLDRLRDEGLLHDDPNRVRLTARGRLLTDAITQRLLPS